MNIRIVLLAAFLALAGTVARAQDSVAWRAAALAVASDGDFAPYLFSATDFGRTPMGSAALIDAAVSRQFDLSCRFSWEAGAEMLAGVSRRASYQRFSQDDGLWYSHDEGPATAWIQQLYASVKWRGVFLSVGARERGSVFLHDELSSGDLISGCGARPIPQVRAGFVDFQDIPLTRGFIQILGCIAYGKMADNDYLRNHYNYWNEHINTGALYTYKHIYLRSRPDLPLSVTIGMQSAGFFGGTTEWYMDGRRTLVEKNPQNLKAFWKMLLPSRGNGDGYYEGSALGSWDLRARWRFGATHEIAGYFQWLWEDGSSLARRNKWDGLWGIEYRRVDSRPRFLEAALAEYIDFRDQSGPIHWAPGDYPGTDIVTEATGGDDYYNNSTMNAYANFGLALGSPFLLAPLYNRDGRIQFVHSRTRGFHLAASGHISPSVAWKAILSHAVAWGSGREHTNIALHNTSALVGASWQASSILPGLAASAALSFDAGSLRGDVFGALVSVSYSGNISLAK